MDITALYALGLQTIAVITLVYLVAILGARAFSSPDRARPPRRRRKSPAYNAVVAP